MTSLELRPKADLLALAVALGIPARPSWSKASLVAAIADAEDHPPPADLADAGRVLWADVHAWLDTEDADLEAHELVLLAELCRTADRLATIRGALATVDPTDPAWCRLASEERQRGLAMARLVSSIGFPTGLVDATGKGATPRSRRAQTAAQQRWTARPLSAVRA